MGVVMRVSASTLMIAGADIIVSQLLPDANQATINIGEELGAARRRQQADCAQQLGGL